MKKLEDYALIGDCNSAALVGNDGSIDWCCMPVFDSPALFSSLLGEEKAGFFRVQPTAAFESAQKYIPGTNVVQTSFKTSTGTMTLDDAFSVFTNAEKRYMLHPDHELLRIAKCTEGKMTIRMDYRPMIFYGKKPARIIFKKNFGFKFHWKTHIFILQSNIPYNRFVTPESNDSTHVEFTLKEGEEAIFSLSYSCQNPAIIPEVNTTAGLRMDGTIRYWREWIDKCKYSGNYPQEVERSLLAIKLLVHAPSGAIIAAPTTSLPEEVGGTRNWDYRYCWLRDASFTVRALLKMGYEEEIQAFMNWILHATKLTFPRLQMVYTIYGENKIPEKKLHWLSGYRNSKPVRIGNGASSQFQLDVYGEVLDAFFSYSAIVPEFDNQSRRYIIKTAKRICKIWTKPDDGIWEIRGGPKHHTHSKVMAWVGLDRAVKLIEKYNWKAPLQKFKDVRHEIAQDIDKNGYNRTIQSYTQVYGEDYLDASLLTLSLVDFCDASNKKMRSTVKKIEADLSENGFIYRYKMDDGLEGEEASFVICTFWYIENLIRMGELDKAKECFEIMLSCTGPAGLLSEEVDSQSKELRGNHPQGFSHIGLINAAYAFQQARKKQVV